LQDYHVILIQQNATKYLVYDLDSTIDFPCEIHIYWKETMRTDIPLNERYRRWFRVVNALEYLKHFSSDRRHMRNDRNEFVAPPPCWPPIFDESTFSCFSILYPPCYFYLFSMKGICMTCEILRKFVRLRRWNKSL
ncbi:unnamed protein product, partial [Toxocara canis]|uniref:Protein N-terminal glutamine amidohydrolase n=1 Tax=Toxocara canis TaxID=6265 RepID=A0A183TUY1_TOXCA